MKRVCILIIVLFIATRYSIKRFNNIEYVLDEGNQYIISIIHAAINRINNAIFLDPREYEDAINIDELANTLEKYSDKYETNNSSERIRNIIKNNQTFFKKKQKTTRTSAISDKKNKTININEDQNISEDKMSVEELCDSIIAKIDILNQDFDAKIKKGEMKDAY